MLSEDPNFWAWISGRLLHPIQMAIIEALLWVDRPLSASDMTKILANDHPLSIVAYHFRRLARLGLIEPEKTEQIRGTLRRPYRLARPAIEQVDRSP